jgi:hypothetical protein
LRSLFRYHRQSTGIQLATLIASGTMPTSGLCQCKIDGIGQRAAKWPVRLTGPVFDSA